MAFSGSQCLLKLRTRFKNNLNHDNFIKGYNVKTVTQQILFALVIIGILGIEVSVRHAQAADTQPDQQIYFLQEDGNLPIIELYKRAKQTVYVATSVIKNPKIASELVDISNKEGVKIKVLLEERQVRGNRFSQHITLLEEGKNIEIKTVKSGLIVSDFGIIDDDILYTGGALLHSVLEKNPKFGSYIIFFKNQELLTRYQTIFNELFDNAQQLRI